MIGPGHPLRWRGGENSIVPNPSQPFLGPDFGLEKDRDKTLEQMHCLCLSLFFRRPVYLPCHCSRLFHEERRGDRYEVGANGECWDGEGVPFVDDRGTLWTNPTTMYLLETKKRGKGEE